jgi:anti-sigma factor (TIGR02949 family)
MTCDEAVKRLYDYLNSEYENLTSEQMEKHLALCKTCCDYCRFNEEIIKAIQSTHFQKKASLKLKDKILKDLNLSV